MQRKIELLLEPGALSPDEIARLLEPIGFQEPDVALNRLRAAAGPADRRQTMTKCLPMLLAAFEESAAPDASVLHLERLLQTVDDPLRLLQFLADNPRAVEILLKLFVSSRYLTEILIRNVEYLDRLTNYGRVAEFKSREEFFADAFSAVDHCSTYADRLDALRRCQQWEQLRLAACDSFGLFDLKSVTLQLSLMADALVQAALHVVASELEADTDSFVVLAFGKLGGEELNYSSDIDLVFLAEESAERFWELGQKLIRAIMDTTSEGFLYRVDMRLRPWGQSGPLVSTTDTYQSYLARNAAHWEKQALVKARPIAGNLELGRRFLKSVESLIFETTPDELRQNVVAMKGKIESGLRKRGREYGEVKSGQGSIRDIEFLTQFLQLLHGKAAPHVRSRNTLDGLVRLADFECILPGEYRQLTTAYIFLRRIEHALQLLHHQQEHRLPTDERELTYLARRLDFPDASALLDAYDRHSSEVRTIYDLYLSDQPANDPSNSLDYEQSEPSHAQRMDATYREMFSREQIEQHAELLSKLTDSEPVAIDPQPGKDGTVRLLVAGFDQPGELAVICGLLFVYGFDIVSGEAFSSQTAEAVDRAPGQAVSPFFVDVFELKSPAESTDDVWQEYSHELKQLASLTRNGNVRQAQGQLVRRVADALQQSSTLPSALLPIELRIDNEQSDGATVLQIGAADTPGFLYELANSLTLLGFSIQRVALSTRDHRAIDTFFVVGPDGRKVEDPELQNRLRTAIVLVQHFTHLLPGSPGPRRALERFSGFLTQLFDHEDWAERLVSIDRRDVLEPLARLLGVSEFLWDDYLKPQHENLFPILNDVEGRSTRRTAVDLEEELRQQMSAIDCFEDRCRALNDFKDREMFRVDMRHIGGQLNDFREFSEELSDVADSVVRIAVEICIAECRGRWESRGEQDFTKCPCAVAGLGKAGGRELGFASDIELMFLYDGEWRPEHGAASGVGDFYSEVVKLFVKAIRARRKGIFEVDLRLRPYGNAGPLAVSTSAFEAYFRQSGPAWPFERQALVKLRPIAGDRQLGETVAALRDDIVYGRGSFDVASMKAMRERQIQQHVTAGTWNAKLSEGGLVDCEYLVQGLQITYGKMSPAVRTPNTHVAIGHLASTGQLSEAEAEGLSNSYVFLRRLIDALRMVRGDARDLTVPNVETEEFEYLARRLSYGARSRDLQRDIDDVASRVCELQRLLEPAQQ
ncbi:MAG: [protein-PII] uridylyltransferase family protein [Planctomycetota bacterium]|jgi:glutamate-ammonia-ligase adenylyltransferase